MFNSFFYFLFLLVFSMFVFISVWCHYVWRPRALVLRRLSKSTDLICICCCWSPVSQFKTPNQKWKNVAVLKLSRVTASNWINLGFSGQQYFMQWLFWADAAVALSSFQLIIICVRLLCGRWKCRTKKQPPTVRDLRIGNFCSNHESNRISNRIRV